MRPTQFFPTKKSMTHYAKTFAKAKDLHWYQRTKMQCNHLLQNKEAIMLFDNERLVQRLVRCRVCNNATKEETDSKNILDIRDFQSKQQHRILTDSWQQKKEGGGHEG